MNEAKRLGVLGWVFNLGLIVGFAGLIYQLSQVKVPATYMTATTEQEKNSTDPLANLSQLASKQLVTNLTERAVLSSGKAEKAEESSGFNVAWLLSLFHSTDQQANHEQPPAQPRKPEIRQTQPDQAGAYWIQTGAYRKQSDADRQRAQLLLLGLNVRIKPLQTQSRQTLYRVQIGPFDNSQAMATVKQALTSKQINYMVLKQHH